jgi:hypothetical protein
MAAMDAAEDKDEKLFTAETQRARRKALELIVSFAGS